MFKNALNKLWLFLLLLAAAKVSYDLLQMLLIESQGRLNEDVLVYLTIGRGILNGLKVYTDLFEPKAPGILYLSAMSLWLTDGTLLMRMLQAVNLLFLPVFFATVLRRRWDLLLTGFLFGGILALWADSNAGGLQTEIFGILPMAIYGWLICKPMTRTRIVICGMCIFSAVFFREPYILGTIAAAMLVSRTPKHFIESFVLPVLLATAIFLVALVFLGLLKPYLQTYLPTMLLQRIQTQDVGPLYLRALWVQRLFSSLTEFSSIPLLGYLVLAFWVSSIAKTPLEIVASLAGALGIGQLFVLFTVFHRAGFMPAVTDIGFLPILALYVLGVALYAGLLWYIRDWKVLAVLATGLVALLFMDLAIGIAGYGARYMLFLMPALVSLFVLWINERNVILVASLLAAMAVLFHAPVHADDMKFYEQSKQASIQLDSLLDACHIDRYVFGGDGAIFALSRHSPIGPLIQFRAYEYLGLHHPLYYQTIANILDAKILVIPDTIENYPNEITSQFDAATPGCARALPGFQVFFRPW